VARIVVVDDNKDFLQQMHSLFTRFGHEIQCYLKPEAALECMLKSPPDLAIIDIIMPGITGSALYEAIRARIGPGLPVIVCSGTKLRVRCGNDPLIAHFTKPMSFSKLLDAANELMKATSAAEL
jgi:CheY-like chemotaxis protein